jgi:hypothetical protein
VPEDMLHLRSRSQRRARNRHGERSFEAQKGRAHRVLSRVVEDSGVDPRTIAPGELDAVILSHAAQMRTKGTLTKEDHSLLRSVVSGRPLTKPEKIEAALQLVDRGLLSKDAACVAFGLPRPPPSWWNRTKAWARLLIARFRRGE